VQTNRKKAIDILKRIVHTLPVYIKVLQILKHLELKGLLHEIFIVIFWLEWIHIGLKGNRFWFLNFNDVSSILDSDFKF
jgi:hypothetical protein